MRILGIELGSSSVKAAEIEVRFRKTEILDLYSVPLTADVTSDVPDTKGAYRDALSNLFRRLPIHPEKIVASLPASQAVIRFLKLPIKQVKKVEKTFQFELEDLIPFRLEDAIVESSITSYAEGCRVVAGIALKKHVESHISWLKDIGLDPDWLTFEGMGLINLFLLEMKVENEDSQGPSLLMDIGHLKTTMSVIHSGSLQMIRTVNWGGFTVTQFIASELGISLSEAEEIKKHTMAQITRGEAPSSDETLKAVGEGISALTPDISHTLVSYLAQYKQEISTIYIAGGSSKMVGFPDLLSDHLGKPVKYFNHFSQLSMHSHMPYDLLDYGEAIGRALVFSRNSPILFNFRKGSFAKSASFVPVDFLLKNETLLKLGKYASILILLLVVYGNVASFLFQRQISATEMELKRIVRSVFPTLSSGVQKTLMGSEEALKKFISKKDRELDEELLLLSKTKTSMLEMLLFITRAIGNEVKVDVNEVTIDNHHFSIDGVLYEGDIHLVEAGLKKIALFSEITLRQEGQRFTFEGRVTNR